MREDRGLGEFACPSRIVRRCHGRSRSTTGRPPTSNSSSGGGAEDQRGDRVGDVGVGRGRRAATARGRRACRPRANRSRSVPAEDPRTADRRQLAARRGRSAPAGLPAGAGRDSRALPDLLEQRAGLVGGRAVDAEADRDAGRRAGRGCGRCRPPSRALDDGQCATPVPVAASAAISASSKWTPWANQTSSPSQPATRSTRSGACRTARGRTSPRPAVSARWVCSRTPLRASARRLAAAGRRSPRTASRARARSAAIEPRRRVVVLVDGLGARRQDRVESSTTSSGGSPPSLLAEVHRAPRGQEPQPDPVGRVDRGAEQVAAVGWGRRSGGRSYVVQPVRASQPRPAAAAARGDVLVDAAPDRVERGQPAEQRRRRRPARGSPTGRGGGGC